VADVSAQVRAAALWLVHGASLARLLAAHGKDDHAENLQAALDEAARILAADLQPGELSEAMSWAADQVWNSDRPAASRLKQ
jgi:hypothetical protein